MASESGGHERGALCVQSVAAAVQRRRRRVRGAAGRSRYISRGGGGRGGRADGARARRELLWRRSVGPHRAADDAADESSVRYAYREDAELAAEIAEFLPVLGADDAVLSPDLDAAPGEIVVRLVGGPNESAP